MADSQTLLAQGLSSKMGLFIRVMIERAKNWLKEHQEIQLISLIVLSVLYLLGETWLKGYWVLQIIVQIILSVLVFLVCCFCRNWLEELWYLRVPAFTAVLSLYFFSGLDQTHDVYRVFALNPKWKLWQICFSFIFILLLSIFIWYISRYLSEKRAEPENKALLWLSRVLGILPLLGLGLGLSFTSGLSGLELFFNNLDLLGLGLPFALNLEKSTYRLMNGSVIAFISCYLLFYFLFRRFPKSCTKDDKLFTPYSLSLIICLLPFLFFVFTLPFVSYRGIESTTWLVSSIVFAVISSGIIAIVKQFDGFTLKIPGIERVLRVPKTALNLITAASTIFTLFSNPASISLFSFLGPVSIVAIFLNVFVIFASLIFYWGYKNKKPYLAVLIILAFIFSSFNWNDNHRLRELSSSSLKDTQPLPTLEKSFSDWINSRGDISKFNDKNPYPVYIVSAQGGGIYAAYHAALTLSRLQDLNSKFASHVFAISGVSGGSLGATIFSSLVKYHYENCHDGTLPAIHNYAPSKQNTKSLLEKESNILKPDLLEAKAHCLLNQDFLSPLLALGFADFVQRFLPFSMNATDRARGIEYAFEQAWFNKPWKTNFSVFEAYRKQERSPLSSSYYDHWNPKGAAPALVLNTTVVETGERLLLSPFTFQEPPDSKFPVLADIGTVACPATGKNHIDFPLSTAAVLSARFPLVTPVGWFERCKDKNGHLIDKDGRFVDENGYLIDFHVDKKGNFKEHYLKDKDGNRVKGKSGHPRTRLADGGYFENSGLSTALSIGKFIEGQKDKKSPLKDKTPPFKVVYLALTDNSFTEKDAGGLNELGAPLGAFYNAKDSRGRSVVEQAEYEIDGTKKGGLSTHQFRQFYLTHVNSKTPVSACELNSISTSTPKECKRLEDKDSGFNLPLGWYLSSKSQEYIRARIGYPSACLSDKAKRMSEKVGQRLPRTSQTSSNKADNNHCVMQTIDNELRADS